MKYKLTKELSEHQTEFVRLCEEDGYEVNYDYSGRGMYGEVCPSITVESLRDVSFNPSKYYTDNMGKKYVIYCPR